MSGAIPQIFNISDDEEDDDGNVDSLWIELEEIQKQIERLETRQNKNPSSQREAQIAELREQQMEIAASIELFFPEVRQGVRHALADQDSDPTASSSGPQLAIPNQHASASAAAPAAASASAPAAASASAAAAASAPTHKFPTDKQKYEEYLIRTWGPTTHPHYKALQWELCQQCINPNTGNLYLMSDLEKMRKEDRNVSYLLRLLLESKRTYGEVCDIADAMNKNFAKPPKK